jgi:hypothetical protein
MNLIDQSLEHVDFALRRRFLWFFRGFSRDDFLAVSQKRWGALREKGELRRGWDKVEGEFEILADRALQLNGMIDDNNRNIKSTIRTSATWCRSPIAIFSLQRSGETGCCSMAEGRLSTR